jgi:hypothetical protein
VEPMVGLVLMFEGQVTFGFAVSVMLTLKVQAEFVPAYDVALHDTYVTPRGNEDPLVTLHPCICTPELLSVAVNVHDMGIVGIPLVGVALILAGHVTFGFAVSVLVTVNVHESVLAA